MTGTEINTMANYHTEGETIDATAALKFINEEVAFCVPTN